MNNSIHVSRLSKLASALLVGCGLLITSLSAGEFGVLWNVRSTGFFTAQINVPSACWVSIYPHASASGGSYVASLVNETITAAPALITFPLGASGGTETQPGYTVSWGPSSYTYGSNNSASVFAIVYSNSYWKWEHRVSNGYYESGEDGQPTAGTYWIEISGSAQGTADASANVSIGW